MRPAQTRLREQFTVPCGVRSPFRVPFAQVRQLHAQNRRLQRVEPEIAPNLAVDVFRLRAVVSKQPHVIGELTRRWSSRDPPSPNPPRFFVGKNEKQPMVPSVPEGRP